MLLAESYIKQVIQEELQSLLEEQELEEAAMQQSGRSRLAAILVTGLLGSGAAAGVYGAYKAGQTAVSKVSSLIKRYERTAFQEDMEQLKATANGAQIYEAIMTKMSDQECFNLIDFNNENIKVGYKTYEPDIAMLQNAKQAGVELNKYALLSDAALNSKNNTRKYVVGPDGKLRISVLYGLTFHTRGDLGGMSREEWMADALKRNPTMYGAVNNSTGGGQANQAQQGLQERRRKV